MVLQDPKWSYKAPMVLVALKQFSETYYMIICYIGPPKRVHNSTKMSLNCTKLIKMAHNEPS